MTVLGDTAARRRPAIAAYGTPHELAITVKRHGGRRVFVVVGSGCFDCYPDSGSAA